jgi:lipid A 3-O-deacylase PagL
MCFTEGSVRRIRVVVLVLALAGAGALRAQSTVDQGAGPAAGQSGGQDADQGPHKGGEEIQVWSGVGHSAINGIDHIAVWNMGLRYGVILTDAHGPGFLRGRLEYAVDAVPISLIFQPGAVAYGAGVNPFAFKWLFDRRGRVAPYFEFGGGVLFTSRDVPTGVSNINFASGSAIGANVGHGKAHWSMEVRWLHISDAGLTAYNPGINLIQARVGVGWFHHRE